MEWCTLVFDLADYTILVKTSHCSGRVMFTYVIAHNNHDTWGQCNKLSVVDTYYMPSIAALAHHH